MKDLVSVRFNIVVQGLFVFMSQVNASPSMSGSLSAQDELLPGSSTVKREAFRIGPYEIRQCSSEEVPHEILQKLGFDEVESGDYGPTIFFHRFHETQSNDPLREWLNGDGSTESDLRQRLWQLATQFRCQVSGSEDGVRLNFNFTEEGQFTPQRNRRALRQADLEAPVAEQGTLQIGDHTIRACSRSEIPREDLQKLGFTEKGRSGHGAPVFFHRFHKGSDSDPLREWLHSDGFTEAGLQQRLGQLASQFHCQVSRAKDGVKLNFNFTEKGQFTRQRNRNAQRQAKHQQEELAKQAEERLQVGGLPSQDEGPLASAVAEQDILRIGEHTIQPCSVSKIPRALLKELGFTEETPGIFIHCLHEDSDVDPFCRWSFYSAKTMDDLLQCLQKLAKQFNCNTFFVKEGIVLNFNLTETGVPRRQKLNGGQKKTKKRAQKRAEESRQKSQAERERQRKEQVKEVLSQLRRTRRLQEKQVKQEQIRQRKLENQRRRTPEQPQSHEREGLKKEVEKRAEQDRRRQFEIMDRAVDDGNTLYGGCSANVLNHVKTWGEGFYLIGNQLFAIYGGHHFGEAVREVLSPGAREFVEETAKYVPLPFIASHLYSAAGAAPLAGQLVVHTARGLTADREHYPAPSTPLQRLSQNAVSLAVHYSTGGYLKAGAYLAGLATGAAVRFLPVDAQARIQGWLAPLPTNGMQMIGMSFLDGANPVNPLLAAVQGVQQSMPRQLPVSIRPAAASPLHAAQGVQQNMPSQRQVAWIPVVAPNTAQGEPKRAPIPLRIVKLPSAVPSVETAKGRQQSIPRQRPVFRRPEAASPVQQKASWTVRQNPEQKS